MAVILIAEGNVDQSGKVEPRYSLPINCSLKARDFEIFVTPRASWLVMVSMK